MHVNLDPLTHMHTHYEARQLVMQHLMMRICSEKCGAWQFWHYGNILECTFINLDGMALGYITESFAPRLQICIRGYFIEYCS